MEKIDYKHGKFNILTTSTDGFTYEDYVDYCEDNGIKPAKQDSPEYYNWVYGERDLNFESDMDNISTCKQYKTKVVAEGKLGLWDGHHTVIPRFFDNVADAIRACIEDCDDCNVWYNDGAIEVEGYHHDGTNSFTIHALSKKGINKYESAVDHGRDVELIKTDYKRLPYLYAI